MPRISEKVIYPELSYALCGLCFVVQNRLGRFRSERQYADFLESLLTEHANRNRPDFVIGDKVVFDLKTKRLITKEDYFQMKRYLTSARKRLGLIVNFRPRYVVVKRVLNPTS